MMKINKITALLALAVFTCGGAFALELESAVAVVNGTPILQSDFEKVANAYIAQLQAAQPRLMEQPGIKLKVEQEVLDQMINDELLYQVAVKEGVKAKDSEIDEALENAKKTLVPERDAKTGKDITDKERTKQFEAILKKEGLTLKQFRERLRKQIISRKYIETVVVNRVKPVEEADARALFDEVQAVINKDAKKIAKIEPAQHKQDVEAIALRLEQLSAPKVKVGHILFAFPPNATDAQKKEIEAKAKEVKKQLDGGLAFSEAVVKFSDDKAGVQQTGGDMILVKGIAPKTLDEKAFSLDVGQTSAPIKTDIGFHIIKIKEKAAGTDVTFELVARELGQFIAQRRIQTSITDYVAELRSKADIKINKDFSELEKIIAEQQALAQKEDKKADVKKEEPKKAEEKKAS